MLAVVNAVAVAAIAAPVMAASNKHKTKSVSCSLRLYATIEQPAPTASNVGTARCKKGLGSGMQRDSSTVTRSSPTTGSFDGRFKIFFNRGAISGTFHIAYIATLGATDAITGVTYSGTLKITRGTAAYKKVRGTGTVTGASLDAASSRLTYKLKLSGLKRLPPGNEFEQFCQANPGAC